jgi:hypothetical protein
MLSVALLNRAHRQEMRCCCAHNLRWKRLSPRREQRIAEWQHWEHPTRFRTTTSHLTRCSISTLHCHRFDRPATLSAVIVERSELSCFANLTGGNCSAKRVVPRACADRVRVVLHVVVPDVEDRPA